MKVALIADVHANLPALEAVLAHARKRKVQAIWNAGDFVGYGPFPDEVVRRVRAEKALSIAGNYDLKVLHADRPPRAKDKDPEKRYAFKWALDNLSPESREHLASLPKELRLNVAGWNVLITHGSPESPKEHLTPETPKSRLRRLARKAKADLIVCGHSHVPFARRVGARWFVNPGSVGRPDDGNPQASYAVIALRRVADESRPDSLMVRHYRVPYDAERTAERIRQLGLPESFARMVLEGRSLEGVQRWAEARAVTRASAPAEGEADTPLQAVLQLAEKCRHEPAHTRRVTLLALRLFDELQPLHGLGATERFWLHCAGLLHDIGWVEGRKGHHKTALRMILTTPDLPFERREREIIGCVARYHRRGLPAPKHKAFAALSAPDQRVVRRLAAILRVADGLDCTHRGIVKDVTCAIGKRQVGVYCLVPEPAEDEQREALKKGDLFEKTFDRKLVIEWRLT
jgi:putative phosphoesterase